MRAPWLALATLAATMSQGQELPSVASINLCADQLVLTLADPRQVVTVSWLAADAEESLLAAQAASYPLNYGTAEELLSFAPDVVIAGAYTSFAARRLLSELGYLVVAIEPAATIEDIERNLRIVADAIGRPSAADRAIDAMRRLLVDPMPRLTPVPAIVVRPGGFTVGPGSLADEIMQLAGLSNVAAEQALDRWGSLSVETLLRSAPELLIITRYRDSEASLANAFLDHPALRRLPAAVTTVAAKYWACGIPASLESLSSLRRAADALRR